MAKAKKGEIKPVSEGQVVVKKPMGQPRKILDEEVITQLAQEDCTVREIASRMGCSMDTIYANYSVALQKGRDIGNCSIKRKMFEIAMGGSVPMLIWLSKQRLGYKDQQPMEATQINFNVNVVEVPK